MRARTVREDPHTELAAVFDTDAALAAAAATGTDAKIVDSFERLLDVPLDAVILSSPIQFHEEQAVAAFGRGLHVLVEKPVANTAMGARRMVDASLAAGKAYGVGFNLRYYPSVAFVKDALESGAIGELDHLRVFGGHDGLHNFQSDWQYKAPVSGGGAMWDVGIHMTDVARFLLGDITEVYGVRSESIWRVPGSEDNAIAVFRSPLGIPASYHATWTEWKGYRFFVEAYGSRGMVRGSYAPMQNLQISQEGPGKPRRTRRWLYPEIMVREKLFTWKDTALRTFRRELSDFVALAGGNTRVRIADGHDGLRAIEVADAVRESTTSREAVHLPALGRMSR